MSFGRLERGAPHRPMAEINMTPLVDVVLVLLVIFMVAAPLMAHRLALQLPSAAVRAPVPAAGVAVTVAIDAQGRLHWGDTPVLPDELDARLREAARLDPATEVHLRADTTVPYGRVLALIAQAQAAGLSRIGFVAEPGAAR